CFDILTGVHPVETILPVIERRHLGDNRAKVNLPCSQHWHNLFPILKRMAEAALQMYGLLHQRVKRKVQRLRPPPNFSDLTSRAENVEGSLHRRRDARRIDYQISPEPVADFPHVFDEVRVLNIYGVCGSKQASHIEPRGILCRTRDNYISGASDAGHLGAKQANRPRANHDDCITGSDSAFRGHRVICDTARLGKRGAFEWKFVRDVVQTTSWDAYEAGHRTVCPRTEARTTGAEVVFACAA